MNDRRPNCSASAIGPMKRSISLKYLMILVVLFAILFLACRSVYFLNLAYGQEKLAEEAESPVYVNYGPSDTPREEIEVISRSEAAGIAAQRSDAERYRKARDAYIRKCFIFW